MAGTDRGLKEGGSVKLSPSFNFKKKGAPRNDKSGAPHKDKGRRLFGMTLLNACQYFESNPTEEMNRLATTPPAATTLCLRSPIAGRSKSDCRCDIPAP